MPSLQDITAVIPARNEAPRLGALLNRIQELQPGLAILVIDDGSTDDTAKVASENGAVVIRHPYPMGNGAAIKSGIRALKTPYVVFMDGDGQHAPEDLGDLFQPLDEGYDMVIGARSPESHATPGRRLANRFFNKLASWVVDHPILDLTSGFRAVKSDRAREFLYLLPNGFSYPSTLTMALFRAAYPVTFQPIHARQRTGKSHIRPMRDATRFVLIILRIGALYSPLKLFFPTSLFTGSLGFIYYLFTYLDSGRFTNMGALLLTMSILMFLMGLLAEQITTLIYKRSDD